MNENKKVQVSFVIDEDIYSEYKAILAIERTRVTTDIVKYIEKRVQDNLEIDKELFKEYKNIVGIKGVSASEDISNYMRNEILKVKNQ